MPEPTTTTDLHVAIDGAVRGPLDEATARARAAEALRSGKIPSVWSSGWASWRPASEVWPDLAVEQAGTSPSPPPPPPASTATVNTGPVTAGAVVRLVAVPVVAALVLAWVIFTFLGLMMIMVLVVCVPAYFAVRRRRLKDDPLPPLRQWSRMLADTGLGSYRRVHLRVAGFVLGALIVFGTVAVSALVIYAEKEKAEERRRQRARDAAAEIRRRHDGP